MIFECRRGENPPIMQSGWWDTGAKDARKNQASGTLVTLMGRHYLVIHIRRSTTTKKYLIVVQELIMKLAGWIETLYAFEFSGLYGLRGQLRSEIERSHFYIFWRIAKIICVALSSLWKFRNFKTILHETLHAIYKKSSLRSLSSMEVKRHKAGRYR